MKLDFRTWLEDDEQGQERYNNSAVDAYVLASSRPASCAVLVNKFLRLGRGFIHEEHQAPISNNLLVVTDTRLGTARTVFDSQNTAFKFYDEGKEAGNIWLRFPPVIFTKADRVMLKGILIHELTHAEDWLAGTLQPSEGYSFRIDLYLKNVSEVKALHAQLRYLLKRVGNVEQVVKLLGGDRPGAQDDRDSPFAMNTDVKDAAAEFLKSFQTVGEGLGSFFMPLVAAAGMGGDPATADFSQKSVNPEPTRAVYNIQQEDARHAASTVMRIVQAFTFSQYVVPPGKKN